MTSLQLSPAERATLRAQAHGLKPCVLLGDAGLTPAVLAEVDRALSAHALIKVKVAGDDRDARSAILDSICDQLGAGAVQAIGKILVVWRPKPMPDLAAAKTGKGAAPKQVKVVIPSSSPTHRAKVKRVTVLGNQRLTSTGKVKRAKTRQSSIKKIKLG